MTDSRVLLGAVAAAHGIKGEVRVKTFTEGPEGLSAYGPVTTEDGRELRIASLRAGKAGEAIVQFQGIADRNAAENLKGQALYVPRAVLPAPNEGEYYLTDLIGLKVEDATGHALGTVLAVHNFGAGDMIEIEREGGTQFIRFTLEAVPIVDIAGGRIVVQLQYDAQKE